MRVSEKVGCMGFPCGDVNHAGYILPEIEVDPQAMRVVMISEATPVETSDYYYTAGNPLFQQTTVQAFRDAGVEVSSVADILRLGVYLTTAVKCSKTSYGIRTGTIQECARMILEKELALFPNVKAYLLMGDVAIQAVNYLAKKAGEPRVIPAGSTYKIRGGEFFFHGVRAFPSYLQAGPSFFIEKSKRRAIAEDIAAAMRMVLGNGERLDIG